MAAREREVNFPANLHVLIMAGGSGTRFWPKSRASKPKQLLALWDDKTLLEHTVERFAAHVPQEHIWIVTTERLVQASRETLDARYSKVRFLGEPAAKNTAACILWGVREIAKVQPEAMVAVMPADHYIGDEEAFHRALLVATAHASARGGIVTLGIAPNRPETGYGYIELGSAAKISKTNPNVAEVKQFVEKPDLRTANRYIESGRYVWNAGMFIFKAADAIFAFERTMPELSRLFSEQTDVAQVYTAIGKQDAVSVDYGVMEPALSKGISIATVPVDCGWNDVGSFPALEDINCETMGEVVSHESASNVVQTDAGIVALLGVSDLVVVRDGDVVLVAAKERAQDVKALLEKVRARYPEKL